MKTNNQTIKKIAKTAFPNYTGRKFSIEVQTKSFSVASYWEGGSRDYFVFVDLRNGRTIAMPQQSAYDEPINGANECLLPPHCACVSHCIFCGKDAGLKVILPNQDVFEGFEQKQIPATNQ